MPPIAELPRTALFAATLGMAAMLAFPGDSLARSSDRNQEMVLESDRSDCGTDDTGTCEFTGNVRIRQGTLRIEAARATLHRQDGDVSRAVLSGAPVVLRQEMDDGTPLNARSAQIDYNLRTEVVVFTGGDSIEQPRGTLSGERVVYNLQSGRVEGGGEGAGRVRMRILPRGGSDATPAADDAPEDSRDEG